jgi:predicted MPP superfamily phosphohydrolase
MAEAMPSSRPSSVPPPKGATRAIGKQPRMSRFLRVLIALTAVVHVAPAFGVAEGASRAGWRPAWAFGLAFFALGVSVFARRAGVGLTDSKSNQGAMRLFDIAYQLHWCACLFSLLPSAVLAIALPLVDLGRGATVSSPAGALLWTYAVGLAVNAWGVLVRRRWFVIERVEVPIRGLDPRLDGFRIAHLSDLHIGTMTPRGWGERWVRAANALSADVAVVTGDMVTSGTEYHEDIAAVVGGLRARHGVYVSMGNHDYFGEGEPLISMIRARGTAVLRNDGVVLEHDGARLFLAAIDDTWTRRADMDRALAERPPGVPTVLLAHDPEQFPRAAKRGVDLVLSGHTHGGQIAVPFLAKWLNLSAVAHHFTLGLYRKDASTLYVHPGLGTTGPPVRIGVAPAVVLLTLRAR